MKLKKLLLFLLFLGLYIPSVTAAGVSIKFVLNGQDVDRDQYKTELFKMILSYTNIDYDLYYYKKPGGHALQIERLRKGIITVQSFGATKILEEKLIPVRIPIFKGLIGHRIFLINKKDQYKFDKVTKLDDLRKLMGIQGKGWTDVKILEDVGLPQRAVPGFAIYRMLNRGGRADYFSRAVYEAVGELRTLKTDYPNIVIEKRIHLAYPFAMYFYVSPQYPDLAKKIIRGFHRIIENGMFDKFFYRHPYIRSAIEKTHLNKRIRFELPNRYLSKETKHLPREYWFDMNKYRAYGRP